MKLSPGEKAWIGLGAYVLTADIILWRTDNDTMSIQFGKWLDSDRGKALCFLATAGMIAHLFWSLPIPGQTNLKKIVTYKKGSKSRSMG